MDRCGRALNRVRVAMIGKYTKIRDAYINIMEALRLAGIGTNTFIEFNCFETIDIEKNSSKINEVLDTDRAVILLRLGHRGFREEDKRYKSHMRSV